MKNNNHLKNQDIYNTISKTMIMIDIRWTCLFIFNQIVFHYLVAVTKMYKYHFLLVVDTKLIYRIPVC
jgi:hypothetical protein